VRDTVRDVVAVSVSLYDIDMVTSAEAVAVAISVSVEETNSDAERDMLHANEAECVWTRVAVSPDTVTDLVSSTVTDARLTDAETERDSLAETEPPEFDAVGETEREVSKVLVGSVTVIDLVEVGVARRVFVKVGTTESVRVGLSVNDVDGLAEDDGEGDHDGEPDGSGDMERVDEGDVVADGVREMEVVKELLCEGETETVGDTEGPGDTDDDGDGERTVTELFREPVTLGETMVRL
jgi:hypothetical protein